MMVIYKQYMGPLKNCTGFEWDSGNLQKNWMKHTVSNMECEQCFFNKPLIVANDEGHSQEEERYFALGRTNLNRPLLIVFTIRRSLIRIISARDMSRKERAIYETRQNETP